MRTRLVATVLLGVALTACDVKIIGDLEVNWSVEKSMADTVCTTYNIGEWRISATGPEAHTRTFACGSAWSSGQAFYGIEEGIYTVKIEALEQGTGTVLAVHTTTDVDVLTDALNPAVVTHSFSASDFGGGGDIQLNVFWNINGTVDGSPKGVSWDTCSEVGADKVVVSVDGNETQHDCDAKGKQSAAILLNSDPKQVKVKLIDASGKDLTTWTPTTPGPTKSGDIWEYVADFPWNSFIDLKDTQKGTYLMTVAFEGKSCTQSTPQAAHTLALLKLNGSTVTGAKLCGPDKKCVAADGAGFGGCYSKDDTLDIADQLWGNYKLKVSGSLDAASGFEVCWEKESDILIGAGPNNPIRPHDMPKTGTSSACQ